ncbi:MAG: hypothetical protein AB8G23_22095 [Myxococcota bacterium]
MGNTTLYGQVGYFEGDDENERDAMTEAVFVRGVGRHFLSENQRISLEGSFGFGRPLGPNDSIGGNSDNLTVGAWEARYDHGLAETPVALFLGYRGMNEERSTDGGINAKLTDHSVFVGFTVTLGYGEKLSMLENDRRGATLDTPDIGRWTAFSTELVDEN